MSSPISRDGWSAAAGWTVARAATLIQPNICLFRVDLPELFDQPANLLPLSKSTKTSSYIYFQRPSLSFHLSRFFYSAEGGERKEDLPRSFGHIRDFVEGATLVQDEDRLRPKVASCWRNNGNFLLLLFFSGWADIARTHHELLPSHKTFSAYCTASLRHIMYYGVWWCKAMLCHS